MPMTPIVKQLIILNVLFFIVAGLLPSKEVYLLPPHWLNALPLYSPNTGLFQPFQILTHMFMHASFKHIILNMLGLALIGPFVEMQLGSKRFLGLYFISGFLGLLAHFLVWLMPFNPDQSEFFVLLGASGAVYGVTIAFATLNPDKELFLMFIPIPIKAWVLACGLVAIGLYNGLSGSDGTVAHFAHLGGALAGFILARHWKYGGSFLK